MRFGDNFAVKFFRFSSLFKSQKRLFLSHWKRTTVLSSSLPVFQHLPISEPSPFPLSFLSMKLLELSSSPESRNPASIPSPVKILPFSRYYPPFLVLASSPSGEMDWTTVTLKVKSVREEILRISSSSCGTVAIPENREISGFKRIITTGSGGQTLFRIQGTDTARRLLGVIWIL